MPQKQIVRTEIEVLLTMARFQSKHGVPSSTQELATIFNKVPSAISNAKRKLEAQLLIEKKSGIVTPKGFEYLNSLNLVIPTSVPKLGIVYAGIKKTNANLDATVENLNSSNAFNSTNPDSNYWLYSTEEPVMVPELPTDLPVFSMTVEGNSMLEEQIKCGDTVFVQPFPGSQGPKDGELIVSMYLAPQDEDFNSEAILNDENVDISMLSGPTLKFYYPRDGYYRLSIRKGAFGHDYTITTQYVVPIGRVVGVYRRIDFQL